MSPLPRTLQIAPQRQRVLAFAKAEVAAGRTFPTAPQVAAHMGWKHTSSAVDCLHILAALDNMLVCGRDANGKVKFMLHPEFAQ